jgi:two-component system sensor histidine kinase VicK
MIVVGTFLLQNISEYYNNDFATALSAQAFTPEFVAELESAAVSDDPIGEITNKMNLYSVRMSIDSFRNYYILSGSDASVITGSEPETRKVDITPNILFALDGSVGQSVDKSASYMDFAMPIKNGDNVLYIAYVIDSKEEVYDITKNIFINILWALLFGLLISAFLGFILSRTIIMPISNLQVRAEQMAEGVFGHRIEVRSRDEIGRLTMAFNEMASRLDENLSDIEAEKNKVEAILSQMTDGVVAFDMDGCVIHMNIAAKEYLGKEVESFEAFTSLIAPDLSMESITYLDAKRVVEREIPFEGRTLRALFTPYSDDEEKNGGIVVVLQDITKQSKLENARREFVANVSHELRTPITTIKSYAETLIDMAENEEDVQFVKVIDSEADRMARIVTDLLALSKLDNSSYKMDKNVFDLSEMTKGVVDKMKLDARHHGLEIFYKKDGDTSRFFGDRDKMERVVTNIVSNAVKYTPEGGRIKVVCGAKYAEAYITVEDNGIGIPKADLPRIFERFYRVDKARSRESGGTGLGLAIAKELCEMHGGKIKIDSEEKKGTKVTITLPMINMA